MTVELNANVREVVGKGAARAVRKNKKIPAVVYGEKTPPLSIELDAHSFELLIRKPGLRGELFEIKTEKGKESATLMDIQYHPVTDLAVHVDFKRINPKKPVTVEVNIDVINEEVSPGIKSGGTINFLAREIELVGLITDIPDVIEIDVSSMNIGDVIQGSDLTLPKGITLGLRQDELDLITIMGKMAEMVEEEIVVEETEQSEESSDDKSSDEEKSED